MIDWTKLTWTCCNAKFNRLLTWETRENNRPNKTVWERRPLRKSTKWTRIQIFDASTISIVTWFKSVHTFWNCPLWREMSKLSVVQWLFWYEIRPQPLPDIELTVMQCNRSPTERELLQLMICQRVSQIIPATKVYCAYLKIFCTTILAWQTTLRDVV